MFDSLKRIFKNGSSGLLLFVLCSGEAIIFHAVWYIGSKGDTLLRDLIIVTTAIVAIITLLWCSIKSHIQWMKDNRNRILNRLLEDNKTIQFYVLKNRKLPLYRVMKMDWYHVK